MAETVGTKNIFKTLDQFDPVNTIPKLNDYIGKVYKDSLGDEDVNTYVSRNVGSAMKNRALDVFVTLYSSGNNSDCLIHSILTVTCQNFRRLSRSDKNVVANNFRKNVYKLTPEYKRVYARNPKIEERVMTPGVFLEDIDISNIADSYRIQFCIFEGFENRVGISGMRDVPDVYMLYNAGNNHFEGVRLKSGEYTIPRGDAGELVELQGVHELPNNQLPAVYRGMINERRGAANPNNVGKAFGKMSISPPKKQQAAPARSLVTPAPAPNSEWWATYGDTAIADPVITVPRKKWTNYPNRGGTRKRRRHLRKTRRS